MGINITAHKKSKERENYCIYAPIDEFGILQKCFIFDNIPSIQLNSILQPVFLEAQIDYWLIEDGISLTKEQIQNLLEKCIDFYNKEIEGSKEKKFYNLLGKFCKVCIDNNYQITLS